MVFNLFPVLCDTFCNLYLENDMLVYSGCFRYNFNVCITEMQTGGNVQKLVTADGTYATQSAFSTVSTSVKKEEKYVPGFKSCFKLQTNWINYTNYYKYKEDY